MSNQAKEYEKQISELTFTLQQHEATIVTEKEDKISNLEDQLK